MSEPLAYQNGQSDHSSAAQGFRAFLLSTDICCYQDHHVSLTRVPPFPAIQELCLMFCELTATSAGWWRSFPRAQNKGGCVKNHWKFTLRQEEDENKGKNKNLINSVLTITSCLYNEQFLKVEIIFIFLKAVTTWGNLSSGTKPVNKVS